MLTARRGRASVGSRPSRSSEAVSSILDISDNHIIFEFITKSQYEWIVSTWRYFNSFLSENSILLKIFLLVAVILFALYFYYEYGSYLTIENLRQNHSSFVEFIELNPVFAPICYAITCVVVVGLTIPGATVLCMASGLFFKQPMASFLAWFGCGSGAILCFILVRTICKDCLKSKVAQNSKVLEEFRIGLKANELSYLIYVRFFPIIPFWCVNVSAALLGARFENFALSTFAATIPGTILLTTAGRGLGSIIEISSSHEEISTFSLILKAFWSTEMQCCLLVLFMFLIVPIVYKYYFKPQNKLNKYSYQNTSMTSNLSKYVNYIKMATKLKQDGDDMKRHDGNGFISKKTNSFINRLKQGTRRNLNNIKWSRDVRKVE